MAQKISIPKLTIIYQDPFQFKTLYAFLHDWLLENGYTDARGGDKLLEINYEEQRFQDFSHYRIWWRSFKVPNDSKFIKYHLDIDFLGIGIKKIDIIHEGKKIKAHQGELTLWITSYVEVDWNNFFASHPLLRHFEDWYKRRWMKKELEGHKAEIRRTQTRLQGSIKNYFEMWHYLPMEEVYHKKHEPV